MDESEPDEDTKKKYFQQLMSTVDFCHSKGVYHRDKAKEGDKRKKAIILTCKLG